MGIYDGEVKLHDEKDDLKIKVEQTEENKDKITTYTLPTQQTYVQELYSQPKVENKPSQEVAIPKKEEPEIEIKSEQKTSEDKAPAENEQQQEQPASYEDEAVIFDESSTP